MCQIQIYRKDVTPAGAVIDIEKIPLSKVQLDHELKLRCALTGGDDYALCFTVSKRKYQKFEACFQKEKLKYFCVGEIVREEKIKVLHAGHYKIDLTKKGFQHF